MKQYLLDTNICIFILRNNKEVQKRLREVGIENCHVSEITIAELLYGAENSKDVKSNLSQVDLLRQNIDVVPLSDSLSVYAKEKTRLRKSGNLIDDFDLLIGATAIAKGWTMVTDNLRHFEKLSGINIENWVVR